MWSTNKRGGQTYKTISSGVRGTPTSRGDFLQFKQHKRLACIIFISKKTLKTYSPFSSWNVKWLVRKLVAKLDESSVFDHPHNKNTAQQCTEEEVFFQMFENFGPWIKDWRKHFFVVIKRLEETVLP